MQRKLILDESLANALVSYCESNFILPDDLLRKAIGQKPRQPFLLDAQQLVGRNQTARMVSILNELWRLDPDAFEKAVKGVHVKEQVNKRVWFAKDPTAISSSGRRNRAKKIGDSPWYVSVNCNSFDMTSRVEDVMHAMGCSWQYVRMVSAFITCEKGRLLQKDWFEVDRRDTP